MGVASGRITVELLDSTAEAKAAMRSGRSRAVGHYREVKGRAVVALDLAEAADPAYMTAIIAHELSHVLLLGDRRISPKRPDHERLTDLLTVYSGFGIFTANAALRYATGSRGWMVKAGGGLDERMPDARRNEAEVAPRAGPRPTELLEQGLAYLAGCEASTLPIQRLLETTFTHGTSNVRVVFTPAHQTPVTAILAAVDEAGRRSLPDRGAT
jgi:hypothetical protein